MTPPPRRAACALIVGILGAATGVGQEPTFSRRVEGVRFDAVVTAGGRPVTGLAPRDFEVRENGVLQDIAVAEQTNLPIRLVLAVDASDSVSGRTLDALRLAGAALVKALAPGDRVALLRFGQSVTAATPLTQDFRLIEHALAMPAEGGTTALADATLAAVLMGEYEPERSIAIVFSDGIDTGSFHPADAVVEAARRSAVVVYAVWGGADERPRLLADVTGASGGRLLDVRRPGDVSAAFLEILHEFRSRYVITYTPPDGRRSGWQRVDIRVKRRNTSVRARRGYYAP